MVNSKTVIIRADASAEIGSGHVMRCLTLAEQLTEKGASVFFVCRSLTGDMVDFLRGKHYMVYSIESRDWADDAACTQQIIAGFGQQVELLVVDHYALDYRWERMLRPYTRRIMVIDDLANRMHDCDILLDQNLYSNMHSRYSKLVPRTCQQILGPDFALLRQEFIEARKKLRFRNGKAERILVSFGGSDPTHETEKIMRALGVMNLTGITIDVIVGKSNTRTERIRQLCSGVPATTFHCQIHNMADLMTKADLAIGAGGITTWERCFLGLPSIIIAIAENQKETSRYLHDVNAGIYLGKSEEVTEEHVMLCTQALLADTARLKEMELVCLSLMKSKASSFPELYI